MPHVVIEYSSNLHRRMDVAGFLSAVHEAAVETNVFPVGGIRVRAHEAAHYLIADGHPDNAFVHVVLRVGHGRDLQTRRRAGQAVFAAVCGQLERLYRDSPLGISLEVQEIDPELSFRQNNLHEYVERRQHTGAPP